MPHDWRSAYLTQAKSDYEILKSLIAAKAPLCHRLHYLQMTTEKLAKGSLTLPGGARYPKTHDAFVKFVISARYRFPLQKACGFNHHVSYVAYINSLMLLAAEIENLSPEGFDHPNPEYPWEAGGVIFVPVEHTFAALDFEKQVMKKRLEFIENCFQTA